MHGLAFGDEFWALLGIKQSPECSSIVSDVASRISRLLSNPEATYFMVIKPIPVRIPMRENRNQNSGIGSIFKPRTSRWCKRFLSTMDSSIGVPRESLDTSDDVSSVSTSKPGPACASESGLFRGSSGVWDQQCERTYQAQ